jgi:hypothetical protein
MIFQDKNSFKTQFETHSQLSMKLIFYHQISQLFQC